MQLKSYDLPAGKYVLAVSGGVDSVVLLDLLAKKSNLVLIVAHFDHGIRHESSQDAAHVKSLASKYGFEFFTKRGNLGPGASELMAREARYAYLHEVAASNQANGIVTAHHKDDVLETIIINVLRGTGWRGLASIQSNDMVRRPLLDVPKRELVAYANQHALSWREDGSNTNQMYLRNFVRHSLLPRLDSPTKERLFKLYCSQLELRKDIEREVSEQMQNMIIDSAGGYARHPFIMLDESVGSELLRATIYHAVKRATTRPRLKKALHVIKTAKPNSRHDIGEGIYMVFTSKNFIVETSVSVLS